MSNKRIAIVGGGFFGMYLAEHLAKNNNVVLFEKEDVAMIHASHNNQARVHNGYHYPRSMLTALRSRVSFPIFVNEFRDCVDSEFEKYYLIAKSLSKVTTQQFDVFCKRINARAEVAPNKILKMVNPQLIDGCFSVQEYAFDTIKLRDIMLQRLKAANVDLRYSTEVVAVVPSDGKVKVTSQDFSSRELDVAQYDHVFNCTYSRLNKLLSQSPADIIPLRHEMTEMCLVTVPDELKRVGITVMCGPFFSVMPFPSTPYHSFSHVRYTPHYEWNDNSDQNYIDAHERLKSDVRNSAWKYMIKDACRYIPILEECEYKRSLWEVKTVLPRSESDDSRPILFKMNHGMKGFHSLMGGKIDNVYDIIDVLNNNGF
ncbi:FAD-dependent oxidoreductase [Vibrio sp.]|jgi:glycine/D-amino acid oxidase-like deaminating enzyme|uniref:FAD-dependent oxidoreductase n=1 Tax=Vibrio sp. TaxID=678 RepID=UPI003AA9669A